eukprot:1185304-Amphidinium_carterae.1
MSKEVRNAILQEVSLEQPYVLHVTMPDMEEWPEPGQSQVIQCLCSLVTGTLESTRHVILQLPLHSRTWHHSKFAKCAQLHSQG